ncbi:MAG: DUF853 domain-containing protein [Lachnospiraceae bacterium]|nr:DUF853 domain-containing protein [Lachnospiraceae bacterium]
MYYNDKIYIGSSGDDKYLIAPETLSAHGLIAGAAGTGKTVTAKVLAEAASDMGIPVFIADVKGDLSGMARSGVTTEEIAQRIAQLSLEESGFSMHGYPVCFWDVFGKNGIPARTTVSEMGPVLIASLLGLTKTQSDVLNIIFGIADDSLTSDVETQFLIDTKDLKSMFSYVGEHNKDYAESYGTITKQTLNSMLRNVVNLEAAGGTVAFGEPALDVKDWFGNDLSGRGMINILDCRELAGNSALYSNFLIWTMGELLERLPDAIENSVPRFLFFFDEAQLLFNNAGKDLTARIKQLLAQLSAKGVGVFFSTKSPADIPEEIMGEVGLKIQHALRSFTPNDEKALRTAAKFFRPNPEFDTSIALQDLATGEALISVLDTEGVPTVAERVMILPPQSLIGEISDEEKRQIIQASSLYIKYKDARDGFSAAEYYERQRSLDAERVAAEAEALAEAKAAEKAEKEAAKAAEKAERDAAKVAEKEAKAKKKAVTSVASTASGTVGRQVGQAVGGVFGKFGKTLGGNIGASLGRNIIGIFTKKNQ